MRVWPAIDLRDGKCVRLQQGDYQRETVFSDAPLEIAKRWVDEGADCLHLVDLDGARDGRRVNGDVIGQIVNQVQVAIQLGGGIRDEASIRRLLELGLDRLVIGTQAMQVGRLKLEPKNNISRATGCFRCKLSIEHHNRV